MRQVNIYTSTSLKSPKSLNGTGFYMLELINEDGKTRPGPEETIEITNATANQAAIIIIIAALGRLARKERLEIHTESEYVASAFNEKWIEKWIKSGWKTSKGKDVANKSEWLNLLKSLNGNAFKFVVDREENDNENTINHKS